MTILKDVLSMPTSGIAVTFDSQWLLSAHRQFERHRHETNAGAVHSDRKNPLVSTSACARESLTLAMALGWPFPGLV